MILSIDADSYSYDAKIIAIGLKTQKSEKVWKSWEFGSEEDMLTDFIRHFLSIDDKIVIGFNVLKFDLMLLMLKSKGLPEFHQFAKKINFANIADLFVILTFLKGGTISGLESHAKSYGIEVKLLQGLDIQRIFAGGDKERIVHNMLARMDAMNRIFLAMWDKVRKGERL